MKTRRLLNLLSIITMAAAGAFAIGAGMTHKKAEPVEAAATKSRIALLIEDQCWATSDSRNPILHIWNIKTDSSMGYDLTSSTTLADDLKGAGAIADFPSGSTADSNKINDDNSIDAGFTWVRESNSKRYWKIELPWYITGFTYKAYCGSYWSQTENTISSTGKYNLYFYGSWNSWSTSQTSSTSSDISSSYSVNNYTISATSSGGVSSDGHTAQVKGNSGSYVTSGSYFPRQKISLKATNGTYSSFDHWSSGNSTTSAETYDYVGTANKTYTATFSDTRQKYTVTFKDEDGTTLETKTNVYQGSSVSPTSTPTKADDGGKHYTFDRWKDASGNDKTSALANVQSDLTVYASYMLSYKSGRYATGSFGECNWGVSGASWMPSTGTQYEGQVTLEFGDEFKIAYYNGSSFQNDSFCGYESILESCGAYHYFSGPGNIVCYARGTYNLYFTDGDFGGGKKISIELSGSLNAEHLAAKLMGLGEYAGHCGDDDRFPAMKTVYLGLSSDEKAIFQSYANSDIAQFKNAYDRYIAWSVALGEKPWETGKVGSPYVLLSAIESHSSIVLISIISIVSVATIGGYFFLRKRKENN